MTVSTIKRIVLVDDHVLIRAGIRNLIQGLRGFEVVAEASNIAEALRAVEACAPDIVLTDIGMGPDNGLDLVRMLKEKHPALHVGVLSMHTAEETVAKALQTGACAYLLKESAPDELEGALRGLAAGEVYMSPSLSKKMLEWFVRPPEARQAPLQILTGRQIQILTMIVNGKTTKEIAYELKLSDKTIAAHRAQIMERIGARDRAALVMFAVKHGLIDNPGLE